MSWAGRPKANPPHIGAGRGGSRSCQSTSQLCAHTAEDFAVRTPQGRSAEHFYGKTPDVSDVLRHSGASRLPHPLDVNPFRRINSRPHETVPARVWQAGTWRQLFDSALLQLLLDHLIYAGAYFFDALSPLSCLRPVVLDVVQLLFEDGGGRLLNDPLRPEDVCLSTVIAKQSRAARVALDCFASLAMTG